MTHRSDYAKLLIALTLILFTLVNIECAWVSDDAYITFRTIDNFMHGYGLRWNVDERVQSYTHPLWMMLNLIGHVMTGEFFFTGILVSLLISTLAMVVFAYRVAPTATAALWGMLVFIGSKAFMDYSTSGLENPLAHLLVAGFLWCYLRREFTERNLLCLCGGTALALMTRHDLILVLLPPLIYALWQAPQRPGWSRLLWAFAPFLLWELFSLFYYGFPVPNTGYAKLSTAIARWDLIRQGIFYYLNSIHQDPLTLLMIGGGLLTPLFFRNGRRGMAALGMALYLGYVLWIGGDFMSGRFFTVPLLLAVALLADALAEASLPVWAFLFSLTVVISLSSPHPPWLSGADYGYKGDLENWVDRSGIADERGVYYQTNGLLKAFRTNEMPVHPWVGEGRALRIRGQKVVISGTVGMTGFYAGPGIFIIDECALGDALLARLPAKSQRFWHVGHFVRQVPDGYVESVERGENHIVDPELNRFYYKLSLITRGPLLSWERLATIMKMNLGRYDSLIDPYKYMYPEMLRVRLAEISESKPMGAAWDHPGNFKLEQDGIEIHLDVPAHAKKLQVSYDHNDDYRIQYFQDHEFLAESRTELLPNPLGGLTVALMDVPEEASAEGFNRIRIVPLRGDGMYCIGHVKLIE